MAAGDTLLAENLAYAASNPASSFLDAVEISKGAGAADKILAAAGSRAFASRREQASKASRPLISPENIGSLGTTPKPFGITPTAGEYTDLKAPIDAARMSVLQGLVDQYKQAEELTAVDEQTVRRGIIDKMQPTQDIDQRIKALTKEGLVAKAMINEDLAKKGLSPGQRRAAVAEHLGTYQVAIDNLLEVRKRRMEVIDKQVGDQVSTMQRKEKAMQTRMDLLTKVGAELDTIGASREESALMELTITKARDEIMRLRKTMGKSGVSTKLGTSVSGPYTPTEINAFQTMREMGIETAEDAKDFLIDDLGLDGEAVTNATQRYMKYEGRVTESAPATQLGPASAFNFLN